MRDAHSFDREGPSSRSNPNGPLPVNCRVDEQIILTTDGSREEGGLALSDYSMTAESISRERDWDELTRGGRSS